MDVSMVYAFKNEPLTPKTIQTQGVKLTLAHGSIWSKKGQSRKTIQKISITYKKPFTRFTAHSKNDQKTDYSYYFLINVFSHSVNVGRKRSWTAWDVFSKITQHHQFFPHSSSRLSCSTCGLADYSRKEPKETTSIFHHYQSICLHIETIYRHFYCVGGIIKKIQSLKTFLSHSVAPLGLFDSPILALSAWMLDTTGLHG